MNDIADMGNTAEEIAENIRIVRAFLQRRVAMAASPEEKAEHVRNLKEFNSL